MPNPNIDTSDPTNAVFRTVVGGKEYSFSIQYVPEARRDRLATVVSSALNEAYSSGRISARAEIQTAIRNALML